MAGMKRPDWQTQGHEPDYRFTLANERTFLAWIRTSLALLAGGVALEQFVGNMTPHGLVAVIAIGLTVIAAALAVICYFRWKGNEIAMRHSAPLPSALAIPLLSAALGVIAVLLMAMLIANMK
jgi:putative membrane protein